MLTPFSGGIMNASLQASASSCCQLPETETHREGMAAPSQYSRVEFKLRTRSVSIAYLLGARRWVPLVPTSGPLVAPPVDTQFTEAQRQRGTEAEGERELSRSH